MKNFGIIFFFSVLIILGITPIYSYPTPYVKILKNEVEDKVYDTGTQADWDSVLIYFKSIDVGTDNYEVFVDSIYYLTEPIIWQTSGVSDHPIVIKGISGLLTSGFDGGTMDTTQYPINGVTQGSPAFNFLNVSNIIVKDLRFRNFSDMDSFNLVPKDCSRYEDREAVKMFNSTDILIRNCIFEKLYGLCPNSAIKIIQSEQIIVDSCKFWDLRASGTLLHAVYMHQHSSENIIKNNYVSYCSGDVFRVRDGCNNNLFDGNVVDTCAGHAFYGAWYQRPELFPNSNEIPSVGNKVINTICNGPDPDITNGNGEMAWALPNGNFIRKLFDYPHHDSVEVYYRWPNRITDLYDSTKAFYMPENNHGNTFNTVNPEVIEKLAVNPVIGIDDAYIWFLQNIGGLYKAQLDPNGNDDLELQVNDVYHDLYIPNNIKEVFAFNLSVPSTDIRPRVFDAPVILRTMEGDSIASMLLERWIVQPDSGEKVLLIDGADQRIEFNLTDLAQDYDIFLLPGELHETVLWYLQNDPEQGWEYFNFNAIEKSIKSGTEEEIFYAILQDEEQYCFVVSEKPDSDREKSSQYWIRIIPIEKKSPK
jgi:hypothetical protein